MEPWKPRISHENAQTLLYMFGLLRENPDSFLNADFIEPVTRLDFLNVMDWFEKIYDRRIAIEKVEEKWLNQN